MDNLHNNPIISEFNSALDDFEIFSKQGKQRNFSSTQYRIVLKQKLSRLKISLNALEFDPTVTVEE